MTLRRRVLVPLGIVLIALVGLLFLFTRPPPILTVMTWPGPYSRAQANAQMRPFAVANGVDVRTALWDGELAEIRSMVDKRQFKADVIDFELPTAARACKEGLIEKIDPGILPDGADGKPAPADFVPGAIGPCWVGSVVYSQVMVARPGHAAASLADFFDTRKFPGRRALSRASAKFNLEMALLADGVAPGDVYNALSTPEGLDRAFAKLTALRPIWAHDSVGALRWLKNGQAVMATVLNGDIGAEKDFAPKVIWDHQLYELDVFGIPAGLPAKRKDHALDFIAYATGTEALAAMASWVTYGPARRSSLAMVKPNKLSGADVRPLLPTNPDNFHHAFAVNDGWWLEHGSAIAPRWREFVSR